MTASLTTRPRPLASPDPSPARRSDVDELVHTHLPLVGHLVRDVIARVPAHVNRDDLVSAGMLALTMSARSFDPTRGVPFASFAALRIRGALTDELRGMDWASRAVRSRARDIDVVREDLIAALGRTPTRAEIAETLNITVREVDAVDRDVHRAGLLSIDALTPQRRAELPLSDDGPESILLQREQIALLRGAIDQLPDRLRRVVEDYYFGQRRMAEIAGELGVTESRISQLRSEALRQLRTHLQGAPIQTPGPAARQPCDARRHRTPSEMRVAS
ncbi:MAG: polymerase sigma factor FliA [Pseudonocardiales bacterium]|jgi:RNA polymerase sigma factor for flagellar operon FliA|nr:polymerase sigma factor FliA [Pseudonocardiales bacterium]